MKAWLNISTAEGVVRYDCDPVVTLGRDASSTIQVLDPMVSRNHALIRCVNNAQYYVMDAGSRNGTFLNGQRLTTPREMDDGDVLTLGDTRIVFNRERLGTTGAGELQEAMELGETVSRPRSFIEPITVLVADIRGFTQVSESLPIQTLSGLMSNWFRQVQEVVEDHGGHVDKFIGDCVMALWQNQQNARRIVLQSLQAALAVQQVTADLSRECAELDSPLRVGAGINSGVAATGIGTDSTAMGDAVNLAFRLEGATKTLECDLVLSHSSFSHLRADWLGGREEEILVRGKTVPTLVRAMSFAEVRTLLDQAGDLSR